MKRLTLIGLAGSSPLRFPARACKRIRRTPSASAVHTVTRRSRRPSMPLTAAPRSGSVPAGSRVASRSTTTSTYVAWHRRRPGSLQGPVVTIGSASATPTVSLANLTITGGMTTTNPQAPTCGPDVPTCGPGYATATALGGGVEAFPGTTVTIWTASSPTTAPFRRIGAERQSNMSRRHAVSGVVRRPRRHRRLWDDALGAHDGQRQPRRSGPIRRRRGGGRIRSVTHAPRLDRQPEFVSAAPPTSRFVAGGGIFVDGGSLTVDNSSIDRNTSSLAELIPEPLSRAGRARHGKLDRWRRLP